MGNTADTNKSSGTAKMNLVYGDCTLGVHGKDFDIIFSYQHGGMESLVLKGREWLYRVPKPTFWRATTDNDRGNGFSVRSGVWYAADVFMKCIKIDIEIDGNTIEMPIAPVNNRYHGNEVANNIQISFTYQTITVPETIVCVSYRVFSDGKIFVTAHFHGKKELPQLPLFGMRFLIPTKADHYIYEGISGETYPDRKEGGMSGVYKIDGLPLTPYLVPQDCNVHVETKWIEIYRTTVLDQSMKQKEEFGLRIDSYQENFAFSCIPFTAQELESATHQEELPDARRTVLTILGAVRGVGGVDSWGSDVEDAYQINAGQDIRFSFWMSAI